MGKYSAAAYKTTALTTPIVSKRLNFLFFSILSHLPRPVYAPFRREDTRPREEVSIIRGLTFTSSVIRKKLRCNRCYNSIMLLQKRIAWILLTLLFIFDNVVSYYGVKYLNGREGNLLIAPIVEKYPELYFLCIPLTVVIMIIIAKVLKMVTMKILKKWKFNEKLVEQIILSALVFYWVIANSSWNFIFLLGVRMPIHIFNFLWPILTFAGLFLGLIYGFFLLFRNKHKH